MRNALKNGYAGTFAEIYDAANFDENTFCMFTDAEGNMLWNDEMGDFARTLQNTKYSLSAYIQDISSVLNSMADGDFTAKPNIRYDGDFMQIEESFEQIQSKLSDVVRNINESSEQVLTGAGQMANGSQMLAAGTTTQAGAIEELNSTITSIYDKTQVNAQHALHAKELSDASNAQAEAVQQVTIGIEKISEVVQQNSATAEETAASCEQLSGQSRILREQVSKLKA